MQHTFLKWFAYNHHANNQFIDIFESENDFGKKSINLFSHILNAHLVWLSRVQKLNGTALPTIWQTQAITVFRELNDKSYEWTKNLLKDGNNRLSLDKTIAYKNSKGKSFENTFQEILFHVLMHSMYHRGQVAKLFREMGKEPPVSDFIFQVREEKMK